MDAETRAALESALEALRDDSTPIIRRLARNRIRLALEAALDNTAVEGQEAISDAVHGALWDADAENERLRAALTRIEQFVRDFRAPWGSWKTAWWEGEVFDDAAFTEDNALMHIANVASATLAAKTEKAK